MARELIDYFVLDALADDLESLEDVLRMLNGDGLGWRVHHRAPFAQEEVVPSLFRCIQAGLVRAAVLSADGKGLEPVEERAIPATPLDEIWFELTAHGRLVHENWEPPEPP
jgi:uncharacterized protein YecE (DUF72 family)